MIKKIVFDKLQSSFEMYIQYRQFSLDKKLSIIKFDERQQYYTKMQINLITQNRYGFPRIYWQYNRHVSSLKFHPFHFKIPNEMCHHPMSWFGLNLTPRTFQLVSTLTYHPPGLQTNEYLMVTGRHIEKRPRVACQNYNSSLPR